MDDAALFDKLPTAAGTMDGSKAIAELRLDDFEELHETIYKHGTNALYNNSYVTVCWLVHGKTNDLTAAYQTVSSGEKNTSYTTKQLLDTTTNTWSAPFMLAPTYPAIELPDFSVLLDKCVYQFDNKLQNWCPVAFPANFSQHAWPPFLPPVELLRIREKRAVASAEDSGSSRKCALPPSIDEFSLLRVRGMGIKTPLTILGRFCLDVAIDYTSEKASIVATTLEPEAIHRLDMHTGELTSSQHIVRPYGVAVANDGCVVVSQDAIQIRGSGKRQFCETPIVHLIEPGAGPNEPRQLDALHDLSEVMPHGRQFRVTRSMVFTKDGQHIVLCDRFNDKVCVVNRDGYLHHSFGSHGHKHGEFDTPEGVAVHPLTGEIYICNMECNRVDVFSPGYEFVRSIKRVPTPTGIALDNGGNMAVTSHDVPGIRIFTADGEQWRDIVYCGHYLVKDVTQDIPSPIGNDCGIAFDTRTGLLWVAEGNQVYAIE